MSDDAFLTATERNRCGDCTLCCRLTHVPELSKPIYKMCDHCESGQGCKIYEQRPGSCKRYQCLFLSNQKLADELRPDRCGVIFERIIGKQIYLAICNPDLPGAWSSKHAAALIEKMLRNGFAVAVAPGPENVKHLLVPEDKDPAIFAEQLREALRPYTKTPSLFSALPTKKVAS